MKWNKRRQKAARLAFILATALLLAVCNTQVGYLGIAAPEEESGHTSSPEAPEAPAIPSAPEEAGAAGPQAPEQEAGGQEDPQPLPEDKPGGEESSGPQEPSSTQPDEPASEANASGNHTSLPEMPFPTEDPAAGQGTEEESSSEHASSWQEDPPSQPETAHSQPEESFPEQEPLSSRQEDGPSSRPEDTQPAEGGPEAPGPSGEESLAEDAPSPRPEDPQPAEGGPEAPGPSGEEPLAEEEPEPLVPLDAASLYGIGGPAVRELEDISDLGGWRHYNGLVFGDFTAYQADAEGALAVGGNAVFGLSGGYDVGASYNYYSSSHMGQYSNPGNRFPTLLLGGRQLSIGVAGLPNDTHFNIFGGPVALSQSLYEQNGQSGFQLTHYPELTSGGFPTTTYHDWVIAEQEQLDRWFRKQRNIVTAASQSYLDATSHSISISYFSSYASAVNNTFSYIEDADRASQNPFLNQALINSSGEIDDKVLVINVQSSADVLFSDPWSAYCLPVSAKWAQEYELVIFNFPDAVNVTMTGDPQQVTRGLGGNKAWPDGFVNAAQAAERHAICERVIYNFPQARQVKMSNVYLMGSLMAPSARVEANGGSINGQLICEEFETKGAMELHALTLSSYTEELLPGDDPGYLLLEKYAYEQGAAGEALDGAAFLILRQDDGSEQYYAGNGSFTSLTADAALFSPSAGQGARVEGLPPGNYLLREVQPPQGYALNLDDPQNGDTYFEHSFRIADDAQALTIRRYNQRQTLSLSLRKVCSQTGTGLPDAVFALFRLESDGSASRIGENYSSGPDGSFLLEGLSAGQYQLRELTPPEGYQLPKEALAFTITAGQDGSLSALFPQELSGTGADSDPLLLPNTPGVPDNVIYIYKYSYNTANPADTGTPLAGAAFDLYEEDAQRPGYWYKVTHNGNGEPPDPVAIETDTSGLSSVTHLKPGIYRLVETRAPQGYQPENLHPDDSLSASFPGGYAHQFTVESGRASQVETVSNRPRLANIQVQKTGGDEAAEPLSGARFQLWKYEDGWAKFATPLTTNAEGMLYMLGIGEGRYRLEEVTPPTGYSLPDFGYIYFEISFPEEPGVPGLVTAALGEENIPITESTGPVALVGQPGQVLPTYRLVVQNLPAARDLIVYKTDSAVFQTGVDEDENRSYQIVYLEGAVFQLQRQNGSAWADYGQPFTSLPAYLTDEQGNPLTGSDGHPVPETDSYGNPKTKAVQTGLIHGTYRLVETAFPPGYRAAGSQQPVTLADGRQGVVVHTFTITEAMAQQGGASEYTVSNLSDRPRSSLRIYKTDSDGSPIAYVPFKLWQVSKGAEHWAGDMVLEEVLEDFDSLELRKYTTPGGSSSFYTNSQGVLELEDVEPGVYVLFEHWNENVSGYLKETIYLLSHETTIAEPDDPSFYYHLTVFKVIPVDEGDPSQGVRIQWVDRNKIWNGEAVFDNEANNLPAEEWQQPGNTDSFRSITIVDKRLQGVSIHFQKTDSHNPGLGLEGAEFALYEKTDYSLPHGDPGAYTLLETVTSGSDGSVIFPSVSAVWRDGNGVPVPEGYRVERDDRLFGEYMVVEASPPPGYRSAGQPAYFRLDLNPLSKMLDFYSLDGEGSVTGYQAGYLEPPYDPGTKQVSLGADGRPLTQGTFITAFSLAPISNEKTGEIVFRKVGSLGGAPLRGAAFTLYTCEENHSHQELADSETLYCWQPYLAALSGSDGLISFSDLPAGDYQLVETAAPPGYDLPVGQWFFSLNPYGETPLSIEARGVSPPAFYLAGAADPEAAYWLLNLRTYQLPITGGVGVSQVLSGGMALFSLACLLLCRRQRLSKK